MRVIHAPAVMKRRILPKPHPVSLDKKSLTPSLSSRIVEFSLRVVRPRKRRAKPIINSPPFLSPCFLQDKRMKAKNIKGTAIIPRLKLDPLKDSAKIQAVTVVPIFAPIMTPIALARAIRPAFTKLTSINVVAVEDWTRAVTTIPVRTHLNLFEVI